jgi:hypothetical protein
LCDGGYCLHFMTRRHSSNSSHSPSNLSQWYASFLCNQLDSSSYVTLIFLVMVDALL